MGIELADRGQIFRTEVLPHFVGSLFSHLFIFFLGLGLGLGSGVEKGTQKAITPTFSWVQMASIPYANSGGGEGGHNEQRPSSSDRRKPPSLL